MPCPSEGNFAVSCSSLAATWESLQGILMHSHYSLALMDTNTSVSRHHPLALAQVLRISKQPLHITSSMRAALNLTLAWFFRFPTSPESPKYLEIWCHNAAFSLPNRKKGPDGSATKSHRRFQLQGPQRHPDIMGHPVNYSSV